MNEVILTTCQIFNSTSFKSYISMKIDSFYNKQASPSRELFIESMRKQLNRFEHPCSSSHQFQESCIS